MRVDLKMMVLGILSGAIFGTVIILPYTVQIPKKGKSVFTPVYGHCRTVPCLRGTNDGIPCPRTRPITTCPFPQGGTP